jgi:hypothetical protein
MTARLSDVQDGSIDMQARAHWRTVFEGISLGLFPTSSCSVYKVLILHSAPESQASHSEPAYISSRFHSYCH